MTNVICIYTTTLFGLNRAQVAFQEYERQTLDSIWAQYLSVYNRILQQKGDNKYSLPHTGKRRNGRNNNSLVDLNIDVDAYNDAIIHINAIDQHEI